MYVMQCNCVYVMQCNWYCAVVTYGPSQPLVFGVICEFDV